MQAQVAEPHVVQKAHAAERLVEDICGHLPLERRQLDRLQPWQQTLDGELGDLGDRSSSDANAQRLRLQLRTVTRRALARRLILPQENPDVLLVSLFLQE